MGKLSGLHATMAPDACMAPSLRMSEDNNAQQASPKGKYLNLQQSSPGNLHGYPKSAVETVRAGKAHEEHGSLAREANAAGNRRLKSPSDRTWATVGVVCGVHNILRPPKWAQAVGLASRQIHAQHSRIRGSVMVCSATFRGRDCRGFKGKEGPHVARR